MEKKLQPEPGGSIGSSSAEHFDAHTANIPDLISTEDPEIIAPGQPEKPIETGWAVSELQMIVGLPFFLLQRRYGEIWEIDDEETHAVARAWKPVLDRYLPTEETELGCALLVTAAILAPRLMATDWDQGKNGNRRKQTPPASTRTAASGGSPVSSEKENPENPAEWGVFSKQ